MVWSLINGLRQYRLLRVDGEAKMTKPNRYNDWEDAPATPLCRPLPINGTVELSDFPQLNLASELKARAKDALHGSRICRGIPFTIDKVHVVIDEPIAFSLSKIKVPWLCFLHTAEISPLPEKAWHERTLSGFKDANHTAMDYLNKIAATYIIQFSDGSEEKYDIRYRHQINTVKHDWPDNCFEAVTPCAPSSFTHEDDLPWGMKQHGNQSGKSGPNNAFMNWICAWKNPKPNKSIVGMRIEPGLGTVVLSAITACNTKETPIRWSARRKALLILPDGASCEETLRQNWGRGDYQSTYMFLSEARKKLIHFDMGVVISIVPRFAYNNQQWNELSLNTPGEKKDNQYIVEYAAHPQARAYLQSGEVVELSTLEENKSS